MTNWRDVLTEIHQQHPFLENTGFYAASSSLHDTMPNLLKLSIGTAFTTKNIPKSKLAMVLPRLGIAPLWIAVGTALASIKAGYAESLLSLPSLIPNTRVLVDGQHIALFIEERAGGYYIKVHSGTIPKRCSLDAWTTIPKAERLRLQSTLSQMPLSQLGALGSPREDFLDQVLDIKTFGNRSIFQPQVILVTRVGQIIGLLQNTAVVSLMAQMNGNEQEIVSLFQWGILKLDGKFELRGPGQMDAPPILLFAPDLMAVNSYLRTATNTKPLVILDGSSTMEKLDVLDDFLKRDCSVFACVEHHNSDILTQIAARAFGIWTWSREEIKEILAVENTNHQSQRAGQSIFSTLRETFDNFASNNIVPEICRSPVLEDAARELNTLCGYLDKSLQETKDLKARLYYCLTVLARMIHPADNQSGMDWLRQRICGIRHDVNRHTLWMSEDAIASIHSLLGSLETAIDGVGLNDIPRGKVEALHHIITQSDNQEVVIVVGSVSEIGETEACWRHLILKCSARFCDAQSAFRLNGCEHLIICGWLGQDKMRRLVEGGIANKVTVLLYPFENEWFRSVTSKWSLFNLPSLNAAEKSRLLNLKSSLASDTVMPAPSASISDSNSRNEVEEFELILKQHQQECLIRLAQVSGQETIKAHLVRFAAGYYAFITANHRLPIVTEYVTGVVGRHVSTTEFPRKTVAEFHAGEFVVFREGADGDIIRAIADQGLKKAGKANLRAIAGLWKQALRDYIGFEPKGYMSPGNTDILADLLIRLRGVGIATSDITMTNWISGDYPIGPRGIDTIEKIALATKNTELALKSKDVRAAIKEIRGAHLKASGYLIDKLFEALPARLDGAGIVDYIKFDFKGLGNVIVVQIDTITREPVDVALSKVNYLMEGDVLWPA